MTDEQKEFEIAKLFRMFQDDLRDLRERVEKLEERIKRIEPMGHFGGGGVFVAPTLD